MYVKDFVLGLAVATLALVIVAPKDVLPYVPETELFAVLIVCAGEAWVLYPLLVELCNLKVKVGIPVIIQSGGVAGIINRTVGLNKCRTREQIVRLVVLGDRDVEITDYPLVLLKLQGGPLAVVDELFDSLLKVVEDREISTLNLCVIDGNLCLQFL